MKIVTDLFADLRKGLTTGIVAGGALSALTFVVALSAQQGVKGGLNFIRSIMLITGGLGMVLSAAMTLFGKGHAPEDYKEKWKSKFRRMGLSSAVLTVSVGLLIIAVAADYILYMLY